MFAVDTRLSEVIELERLIDQLRHAVEKFNGKTTITTQDLAVLERAKKALEKFDV